MQIGVRTSCNRSCGFLDYHQRLRKHLHARMPPQNLSVFWQHHCLWWMFSYNQSSNQNPINSCWFFPTSVAGFTSLQQCQVAWVASLIAPLHRKMLCMWALEKVFFRRKEVNLKVALMRTGSSFWAKALQTKSVEHVPYVYDCLQMHIITCITMSRYMSRFWRVDSS